MKAADLTGRPLRAFTGLGLLLALWIGMRLPAMQHDLQALARLATGTARPQPPFKPVPIMAAVPSGLGMAPLHRPAPPPLLALPAPLPPVARQSLSAPTRPPQPAPMPPPAPSSAPPPVPPTELPPLDPVFTLANAAYDRLRAGQRRQSAALFDAALALQPVNRQWLADRAALGRRWQLGGFALLRDGGPLPNQPGNGLPGAAASPVLGGGQVGGAASPLSPIPMRVGRWRWWRGPMSLPIHRACAVRPHNWHLGCGRRCCLACHFQSSA